MSSALFHNYLLIKEYGMDREEIVSKAEQAGIVAVIRLHNGQSVLPVVDALLAGGVFALEVTMTVPNAIELIQMLAQRKDDRILLGAGTVVDLETAGNVIDSGADFIVSPVLIPELIRFAHEHEKPAFIGAFSPTEIFQAWQQGADVVKVFPASRLGAKYFKDIHGPLPQIKLTPTGGVNLENAQEFIRNGASFLGVGTSLLDKQLIADENWQALTERAARFKKAVEQARTELGG